MFHAFHFLPLGTLEVSSAQNNIMLAYTPLRHSYKFVTKVVFFPAITCNERFWYTDYSVGPFSVYRTAKLK